MTLRELVEKHPDWLDYEMAIYREDGELDYVGASGDVYVNDAYDDEGDIARVVIFSGN
jgi:hypothetical protein